MGGGDVEVVYLAYNEGEGWQELEVVSVSFFLSGGFVF